MKSSAAPLRIASAQWAVVAILAGAVLLRCVGVTSRWLWLDELLTVNWSVHGPWAAIVNTLRFDLHPPLYYLQIGLWALPSHDDVWLMANTILWSSAAVGLLIYAASQVYGLRVGLYSGLLLALAPAALAYSDQVRMYSFLVLYGAGRVLATGRRQKILRWFAIECAVGVAALPAVAFALMHRAAHTHSPDLREIAQTWSFLTFGDVGSACADVSPADNCASVLAFGDTGPAWILALAALLLAALIVLAIFDKRTRLPLATLVFAPLILGAIISMFKTMWLPRVFVPIVPFICLIVGMGTADHSGARGSLRTSAFVLLAAIWAGMGMFQQFTRQKGDGFKPAAELVHTMARPGDLVLVDDNYHYWCFSWYYLGPNWGDPRHAFLPDAEWARLLKRLPASVTSFSSGGATVELWDRIKIPPESTADLIVVREQATRQPKFPNRHLASAARVKQLVVERWTQ